MSYRNKLLESLVEKAAGPQILEVQYLYAVRHEEPLGLLRALGISDRYISDQAREALAAIEELVEKDQAEWHQFLWRIEAFSRLHEIFDAQIRTVDDGLSFFEQYYFYYESRMLLAESVLAALNGLYAASDALQRTFLEFNLLQCYYWRRGEREGSYVAVKEYFERGRHPRRSSLLKRALPDDSFCKPIRSRLDIQLSGISNSVSHPYHPSHSPLRHRHSALGHSLEGLFFWKGIEFSLVAVLWAYYVNFPLLFYPVDVLRKFGFAGPVGVVVDEVCADVIKRSLSPDDYKIFSEYAGRQPRKQDVMAWIESLPDLSEEEIISTWDKKEDGPFPGIQEGQAKKMAKLASLQMAMASAVITEDNIESHLTAYEIYSYSTWKAISKHFRK